MGAAIAAITYVYGPNMIEAYGYKASDIPVHNYWINELDRNKHLGCRCVPVWISHRDFIICIWCLGSKRMSCCGSLA